MSDTAVARSRRGWVLGVCTALARFGCSPTGGPASPNASAGASGLVTGGAGSGVGASGTSGASTASGSGGI